MTHLDDHSGFFYCLFQLFYTFTGLREQSAQPIDLRFALFVLALSFEVLLRFSLQDPFEIDSFNSRIFQ